MLLKDIAMRMNQFFSFSRFSRMCQLELVNEGNSYLLKTLLITLLLSLPLFQKLVGFLQYAYNSSMSSIALIMGCSILMYDVLLKYNARFKDVSSLMVPASSFEKILTTLVINLFFILLIGIVYCVFFEISIFIGNSRKWSDVGIFDLIIFLSFMFVVQAFFLLGSLFFRKYSYMKTWVSFFIVLFILACFEREIVQYFTNYPQIFSTSLLSGSWMIQYSAINPDLGVYFWGDKRILRIGYSIMELNWLHGITATVVTFGLWLATYFRLTEKEV